MEWITDPQAWIAFVTLVALELVLGIDNVVFISILSGKLPDDQPKKARLVGLSLAMLMRIGLLFSLSSVLTAIGMVQQIEIMIAAVVIAVVFMMLFAGVIGDFVHRHPTVKMLALSFLLLIGVMLIVDGFGQHIPRGYIYFAMGFSVFVEMLNLRLRRRRVPPVELRQPYAAGAGQGAATGAT